MNWFWKTKPQTPYEALMEHALEMLQGVRKINKSAIKHSASGYNSTADDMWKQSARLEEKAYELFSKAAKLKMSEEPEIQYPARGTPFRD